MMATNPLVYDLVRQDRRARSTKARIVVVDCDHPDSSFSSVEGRWAVVCWTHSSICHLPALKDAIWQSSHPEHWCDDCHEIAELEGIITGEFRR